MGKSEKTTKDGIGKSLSGNVPYANKLIIAGATQDVRVRPTVQDVGAQITITHVKLDAMKCAGIVVQDIHPAQKDAN